MKTVTDGLERYVVRLAKVLLFLAVLQAPFFIIAWLPVYEVSFELPEILKKIVLIYYVGAGVFGGLLSVILYLVGFFIPACVYLARDFQLTAESNQHSGFIFFTLLTFSGVLLILFKTPFNIV